MKQLAIFPNLRLLALFGAVVLGAMQTACTYKKVNKDPAPAVTCNTPTAATISYSTHVWPILKQNCRDACHNPQYATNYANFNMDEFAQVKYQATVNKPSPSLPYSYLVGNIRHEPGYVNMPVGAAKLSDCDIAVIEAWVAAGAPNN